MNSRHPKIFYVTNARLPTEKAHGLATVKLCEAFGDLGADITLVVPRRLNPLRQDTYEYYGVKKNFRIKTLPSIDFLWLSWGRRVFFLIQLFSFSLVAALWLRYGVRGKLDKAVIFSHDHVPLYFASFFAPKIFYDIHHFPEQTILYKRVLQRAVGVAVQTRWKMAKLEADFGVPETKIVYWPNGTELGRFDIAFTPSAAREKLNLPLDKKIIIYAGQLFSWKGVETLVRAGRELLTDATVYIVGGGAEDIQRIKSQSGYNIVFAGQRPWQEIPLWLKAADVLVLPNTGQEKVSLYYTSPMKLFEYMASGRPIVASDIPSIREIVDETMVFFALPDNSSSFAAAIEKALGSTAEATARASRALAEVHKYTWQARAEKIFSRMPSISGRGC